MPPGKPSSGRRQRGGLLAGLMTVVILGGLSAMLGSWNAVGASIVSTTFPLVRVTVTPQPMVGSAVFESSGQVDAQMTQGINDELQIDLEHIPNPDPGTAYYAWLLPDQGQVLAQSLLLGRLTVSHTAVHFHYGDGQQHTDLLSSMSRLLVTEEDAAVPPLTPSLDQHKWRYYGEISHRPNTTNGQDQDSLLDHIRHLLSAAPKMSETMNMTSMQGGLSTWVLLSTRDVFEWASAARGADLPEAPPFLRIDLVRILDVLDGSALVARDVPVGTPLYVDPTLAQVPFLQVEPGQQPPGSMLQVSLQLAAISQSPDTTPEQRQIASHVMADLTLVTDALGRVREATKQLLLLSDAQLAQSATLFLLDALVEQANVAYSGTLNPASGEREGGALRIADQLERLATITIERCSPCRIDKE
jgi:hypothetical protein